MSLSNDPTSPTKKKGARTSQDPRESPQDSSFLRPMETKMSPSDDPTSPMEKNRDRTGQKPRESPEDSSYLLSMETKISPSDDPTSPTEKNRDLTGQEPRESPQDFSFLSSKEPHETFRSFVSLMNRDEEALKSRYGSFSENPNYFERSLDSAGNMESETSNSSAIGVDSDTLFPESTEDWQQAYANYLQILEMEGSQEDPMDFAIYKSMLEDMIMRKRGEIKMMPTPRFDRAQPKWTFKKILTKDDVDPTIGQLSLPRSFICQHIETHMADAIWQKLIKKSEVILDVYDYNLDTMHELRLEPRSDMYLLVGDWRKDFIERRGLSEGDEIGFLCDSSSSRLIFGVVSCVEERASAEEPKLQKEEIEMMPINRDQWPIKKKLSMTDANIYAGQVVLPKSSFEPYLRHHLPKGYSQKLLSNEPEVEVKVYDRDTGTTYVMFLAFRNQYQYFLMRGWREVIVRRKLKEGQEIGLFWDSF